MLNLAAYLILSDRKQISDGCLRFFMNLLCRSTAGNVAAHCRMPFQAIFPRSMFGFPAKDVSLYLRELTALGLLEVGPAVQMKTYQAPTYRLAVPYRLLGSDLEHWAEDVESLHALEEIAPQPISFLDALAERKALRSSIGRTLDAHMTGLPGAKFPSLAEAADSMAESSSPANGATAG